MTNHAPSRSTLASRTALILALMMVPGCFTFEGVDRGADENQEVAGRQERGRDPGSFSVTTQQDATGRDGVLDGGDTVGDLEWIYTLSYTDVILSPDGHLILGMAPVPGPDEGWDEPGLVLVTHDIAAGVSQTWPEVRDLKRINFSPTGEITYALGPDNRTLFELDLDGGFLREVAVFGAPVSALDISSDGRFVVGSSSPSNDLTEWAWALGIFSGAESCEPNQLLGTADGASLCDVAVYDRDKGTSWKRTFERPVRDLDFGFHATDLLVTSSTWDAVTGDPITTMRFVSLESGQDVAVAEAPNCADEVKIQPGGKIGLLAPTWCRRRPPEGVGGSADPISIFDLEARVFVENLPGFGPVVISDDGTRAVGFTRREDMAEQWNYEQIQDHGLIVVDLATFDWHVIELGEYEPAYHLAADGVHLYTATHVVDCEWDGRRGRTVCEEIGPFLEEHDLDSGTRTTVQGGELSLDRFVESPDGDAIYQLTELGALKRIDVGQAAAATVATGIVGRNLNMRPQGDMIVVGSQFAPSFELVSLTDGSKSKVALTAETP